MIKWLEREMIVGPYITLVLSEKAYYKAMAHCKMKKSEIRSWMKTAKADATVHMLESAKGTVCIVALDISFKPKLEDVIGVLIHEAVHIWQNFTAGIGEETPSAEFEAYGIQTISQRLIASYIEQTKKPRKK